MKKVLSLLFVFTLVACGGSDDDAEIEGNDPVIGTWIGIQSDTILYEQSEENGDVNYTFTFTHTYNFNLNGTGSTSTIVNLDAPIDVINALNEVQELYGEPNIGELITSDFNWNNSNNNPNYSNTTQTYTFTFSGDSGDLEFIFNSDFTEFTIPSEEDDEYGETPITYRKQ